MIKFAKVVGNSLKLLEEQKLIKKQGNPLMALFRSKTKEEIYEITPLGTKIFKNKVETTIKKFEKRFNILEDYYQIKNMKRYGLSQYLNETMKKWREAADDGRKRPDEMEMAAQANEERET